MLLPMLATAGTHVPTGEEWAHEVKWDGVRALATIGDRGPLHEPQRQRHQRRLARARHPAGER